VTEVAPGRSGPPEAVPENLRALYDHLLPHLGRWRVEAINGRLVVSPVGTPEHGRRLTRLVRVFGPVADEHGWDLWAGTVDVCLPTREPYEPDFVMAPRDAPRWGEREIFTDGLVMVGEVVSRGSADDDREHKPGIYAGGGVPVMLLVDALCNPPAVTVYSEVKEGRYGRMTSVEMGEKLHIPEPVDFELDTSIFLDE
jgi:Uma2 family endonuclease